MFINRMLYPPVWILLAVPFVSFTALIIIFALERTESMLAYLLYCTSAYSLVILLADLPKRIRAIGDCLVNSRLMKKALSSQIIGSYISDLAFRGNVNIYQGMVINFLYTIFRVITGIQYASVWFISMAVYYLFLGVIRVYLIICYNKRETGNEYCCYRRTAWFLFLLNIPMGGMIVLMIRTNSGFSYPGYVIYLSALFSFCTMFLSIKNLVKYRKVGSPILSAAKVLNVISAMMSILGLQTAMISQFSTHGEAYRVMMNTITGSAVYGIVIGIAIYMLCKSRKLQKEGDMR